MSETYEIEITYTVPRRPEIRVLSPKLKLRENCSRPPHVFADNTLCLHTRDEWRGDLILAETIVPWVCAWLYFYEVWYATGLWLGEGIHPDDGDKLSD